jgi:hypothetical protein
VHGKTREIYLWVVKVSSLWSMGLGMEDRESGMRNMVFAIPDSPFPIPGASLGMLQPHLHALT